MEDIASTSFSGEKNVNKACCRICYDEVSEDELIKPCKCNGSIANVHKKCLDMWLERKFTPTCEICHTDYPTTVNYRWWKVWNHPWLAFFLRKEATCLYITALLNIARTGVIFGTDMWSLLLFSSLLSGFLVSSLMVLILIMNLSRYITWRLGDFYADNNVFFQNYTDTQAYNFHSPTAINM